MNRIYTKNKQRPTGKLFLILLAFVMVLGTAANCKKEDAAKKEGYYTCSMHPQVTRHEPGQCPICGMTLVYQEASSSEDHSEHKDHDAAMDAKSGEHEGHEPADSKNGGKEMGKKADSGMEESGNYKFSLTSNLLANANLATVAVEKRKFIKKVTYSAHIDFNENPNSLVVVNTKYDGWVEKLYVSKEGQWVKKGEPLIGVYSPQILAAKEEYLTTYTTLSAMYASQGKTKDELYKDPTLNATKRKLKYLDVSQSQIESIEKTGTVGRLTYYHSPISGVIISKGVLQGAYIKPGQEIFKIANLSTVWAFIHIFEKDLPFIVKGQKVNLHVSAYPDLKFSGSIDLIYPFLDNASKDIKVRITLENPGLKLRPGMFAEVEVLSAISGLSLIIPDSAIIYSGSESYVFVSLGSGRFELRKIKIKLVSDKQAIVSSGLKENDQVVISGQFLLDSEASLKEAVSKGQASEHQH